MTAVSNEPQVAYGHVSSVRDVPSLGVTRITIELPVECHVRATTAFYDKTVALTCVQLPPTSKFGMDPVPAPAPPGADSKPARAKKVDGEGRPPVSDKPYGPAASMLYKPLGGGIAFLSIPKVQRAAGIVEQTADLALVSKVLAEQFDKESLGYVNPSRVIQWARERGLAGFLPRVYMQCQDETI